MISINTDYSMNILRNALTRVDNAQCKLVEQLSSGMRITQAADDPAGIYMATGLESSMRGNAQVSSNIQTGLSMLNIADGTLSSVNDSLQRVKELSIQAANGLNSQESLNAIQGEINQIYEQIGQTINSSTFNGKPVLTTDSATAEDINLQIADSGSAESFVSYNSGMDSFTPVDVSSPEAAAAAIEAVDEQLSAVNAKRADVGATMSRLESAADFQNTAYISNTSAYSTVTSQDLASGIANLKQLEVLSEFIVKSMKISEDTAKTLLGLFDNKKQ